MMHPLNPEAGFTPYPDNQIEIEAAICAGKRILDYFPYLVERYGERGMRFTNSDTAYLVTITRGDQTYVNEELDWFGKLLSNRGMPRYLLEIHLQFMFEELVKINPSKREQYQKLVKAIEPLKDRRLTFFSDKRFFSLASNFNNKIESNLRSRFKRTGEIIVSAVADENDGIKKAVSSLVNWFVDPDRFPPSWIDAVLETIRLARET